MSETIDQNKIDESRFKILRLGRHINWATSILNEVSDYAEKSPHARPSWTQQSCRDNEPQLRPEFSKAVGDEMRGDWLILAGWGHLGIEAVEFSSYPPVAFPARLPRLI